MRRLVGRLLHKAANRIDPSGLAVLAGLNYIKQRYGSTESAYRTWQSGE